METKYGIKSSPLEKLISRPSLFNFFQVIRLFEKGSFLDKAQPMPMPTAYIGDTALAHQEVVRLKNKTSLSFPVAGVYNVEPATFDTETSNLTQPNLTVSILGLTGILGALPQYYTDFILSQKRLGNTTLADFLDIFDHRLLSFYYRAWAKKRIFINYEKQQQNSNKDDYYALILKSLHGNGLTSSNEDFQASLSNTSVFYAGILAQQPRSACGLTRLLKSYLSLDVSIRQCEGEWLRLEKHDRTILGSKRLYNQLGKTALLGQKVWSVNNKFTLVIGPVDYETFQCFIPCSAFLNNLNTLIKYYINNNLKYCINLILKKNNVPKCRLNNSFQLGWNTWLITKSPYHDKNDTHINYHVDPSKYRKHTPVNTNDEITKTAYQSVHTCI